MMVVLGNDPLESFLNSIQVVRNALAPIESNFQKVTKNFEHCFNGAASKNRNLNGRFDDASNDVVAAQLDLKKEGGQHVDGNGCDRRKRRVPIKIFVGVFKDKGVSSVHSNVHVNRDESVNYSRKGLKERYGNDNGGNEDKSFYGNCLHLDVALSFLINGFVQALPRSFKYEKKQDHKMNDDGKEFRAGAEVKPRIGSEIKQELKAKEGKDLPFEYFIGFVVDRLPKFDVVVQEHECKVADAKPSAVSINQFDHFKAFFSILEGKRADVNGFLGNLMFARVGGVPSSMVGVPSVGDDSIDNAVNQEERGGTTPQKLANGLLSIPLSNVERLRSTLSTVSLTELIELLPQMGRPSKDDHPDKKKLISVQDFFRYTEAEGALYHFKYFADIS